MSYREENGQVILTMSREDYDDVVAKLSVFAGMMTTGEYTYALLNRLNQGNPHYTPYQVTPSQASTSTPTQASTSHQKEKLP